MSRSRSYRNISAKIRFFGLEVRDWGALAAIAGVIFAFSNSVMLNGAAILSVWGWMKWVKAKNPEGYTIIRISRLGSPKYWICCPEIQLDRKTEK